MMVEPVYLDANATTPVVPAARHALMEAMDRFPGNPAASHQAGSRARAAMEEARAWFGEAFGTPASRVTFTSGGTEANNIALYSFARHAQREGRNHVVFSPMEHPAVRDMCRWLAETFGLETTEVRPRSSGEVDVEAFLAAFRPETGLATLMHGNNESGRLQPVGPIAAACRERGVWFHCDTVQSFGKADLSEALPLVDSFTLSAHKFGGPKGIGALVSRKEAPLMPLLQGGSQESGFRSGTPNHPGILAMRAAYEATVVSQTTADRAELIRLREAFWEGIAARLPRAIRNSTAEGCLANTLNVSFPGVSSDMLVIAMDMRGVTASTGSACASGTARPSSALEAMGLPDERLRSAVRLSFLPDFDEAQLNHCIQVVAEAVESLS